MRRCHLHKYYKGLGHPEWNCCSEGLGWVVNTQGQIHKHPHYIGLTQLLKCWIFWARFFIFPLKLVELEALCIARQKQMSNIGAFFPEQSSCFPVILTLVNKTDEPIIFYLHEFSDLILHYFVGQHFFLSWSLLLMISSQLCFEIAKYFCQQLLSTRVVYDAAVGAIPKLAFSNPRSLISGGKLWHAHLDGAPSTIAS